MARRTIPRVWLGLGTAVLAGSVPVAVGARAEVAPAPMGHVHAAPGAATATPSAGGEGGEAGGAVQTKLPPDVRFYRAIQLIRGHLLVGDELIQSGHWDEALPHFLHPTEELYPIVKPDLAAYKTHPFESALKALAQTVKAKKADSYNAATGLVEEQLKRADAGVQGYQKDWAAFNVEVALELMRTASEEYSQALGPMEGGGDTIKSPVEYQDSRGFVWQAARMIEGVAPALEQKDADALQGLRATIKSLQETWPAALPPRKAAKDLSSVLGDIARVELKAGAFQ